MWERRRPKIRPRPMYLAKPIESWATYTPVFGKPRADICFPTGPSASYGSFSPTTRNSDTEAEGRPGARTSLPCTTFQTAFCQTVALTRFVRLARRIGRVWMGSKDGCCLTSVRLNDARSVPPWQQTEPASKMARELHNATTRKARGPGSVRLENLLGGASCWPASLPAFARRL